MSPTQSLLSRHRVVLAIAAGTAVVLAYLTVINASHSSVSSKLLRRRNAVRRPRQAHWLKTRILERPCDQHPLGTIVVTRGTQITARLQDLDIASFTPINLLAEELSVNLDVAGSLYQQGVILATRNIVHACDDYAAFTSRIQQRVGSRSHILLDFAQACQTQPREEVADQYTDTLIRFIDAPASMAAVVRRAILEELRHLQHEPHLPNHGISIPLDATPDLAASASHSVRSQTLHHTVDELKGLLYYIAEEQAKRQAVQHRGVRCEYCGERPIRNIRWHCLNCPDFDLCSTCKSQNTHDRKHVFAEIRIPIPVLSQPFTMAKVFYPGGPYPTSAALSPSDRLRFSHEYGFDEPEIDALADQFVCLASVKNVDETAPLSVAIDRMAFAAAHTSRRWHIERESNVLLQSMFRFYDVDDVDCIGFEQFLSGLAYLRGKHRFASLRRALSGFDFDDDGFVARSDFLRMLRAKFDLHRSLVIEVAEQEQVMFTYQNDYTLRSSHRPISVLWDDLIPEGHERNPAAQKILDVNDNLVPRSESVVAEPAMIGAPHTLDGASLDNLSPADRAVLGLDQSSSVQQTMDPVDTVMLWHYIEQSLNELLDTIFAPFEAISKDMLATERERERHRRDIDALQEWAREQLEHKDGVAVDDTASNAGRTNVPPLEAHILQRSLLDEMIPTDEAALSSMEAAISAQPLSALLASSGYGLQDEQEDESISSTSSSSHLEPHLDPTMPQNMPNAIMGQSRKYNEALPTEEAPSQPRLLELAILELKAQRFTRRNGEIQLSLDLIEAMAAADQTRNVQNLIKSWLSWASF